MRNSSLSLVRSIGFVLWGFVIPGSVGAGFTDIAVGGAPEYEVRYTSGKTIYVEGLVDSQWVGRYWTADGRVNFPYWRWATPAFEIRIKEAPQAQARVLVKGWRRLSASELPRTEKGARHFVVELSNTVFPIQVKVHTLLDGTPVIVRWLEITNTSDKPTALTAVSPWSGRLWSGGQSFKLLYQTPAAPGQIWVGYDWKVLPEGTTVLESVRGNGYDDPFFIVGNEGIGQYFIGHLAWSANWRIRFDRAGGLDFKIGPSAKDALRVLAGGETIQTPAVHLGHVAGDMDTAVQAMHDHIRRFVLPRRDPKRAYLVQLNTPGDQGYFTGGAFNEANIRKCIDVAAAIGAELFLLDCPWYDNYGEWVPSPQRFPNGLEPLVEYAHRKGLLFGLQTEIEGGRGNWGQSKVKREHSDWFGPNNVMYINRPEVAAYMEAELSRVLQEYKPDLYRNEFIPAPLYMMEFASTPREGFLENDYWRYYENWYAVWEHLRAKFPGVIWQQCANGGTREDLGAVSRFDESYTSESGPLLVLPAYSGKTLALPPEILVIGLGTSPPEHLDTHLRVQFTLTTPQIVVGPAPTLAELNPAVRERWLHYTNLYKQFIRPLWPTCKVYHHEPVNAHGGSASSPWFAMEFAAPDRSKGWATIVRIGKTESDTYLFKPRSLDRGKQYQVTFDSTGETVMLGGWELVRDGLPIRLETVMSSELLLFEAR